LTRVYWQLYIAPINQKLNVMRTIEKTEIKLSYSVVKDMYCNLWHHEMTKKELIRKFLNDKQAIISYIEVLEHDISLADSEEERNEMFGSYILGVKELRKIIQQ